MDDIYTYIDKLTLVDTQIESLHDREKEATQDQDLEHSTNIKLDKVCAIDIRVPEAQRTERVSVGGLYEKDSEEPYSQTQSPVKSMMTKTPKADTNINSVINCNDTKKKDNHAIGNLSDLESPLKVAKSHYESSFVEEGTLSPTHQQELDQFSSNKKSSRVDQFMDRISLNAAAKALKGPYDNISDEEQKSPIIDRT